MNNCLQLSVIDLTECNKELKKLLTLDPQMETHQYVRTFMEFQVKSLLSNFIENATEGRKIGKHFIALIENVLRACNLVYFTTDHEELVSDNLYVPAYNCFVHLTGKTLHKETPMITKLEKTSHGYPSLKGSLDKVHNLDDLGKWFQKIIKTCRLYQTHIFVIALSYKYDGVSVVLEFDSNGRLLKAVTRGEEDVGNDVTAMFSHIRCRLDSNQGIGIKTEAVLTEEKLQKYNELTGNSYKNRRSGITSIMNSANSSVGLVDLIPLDFDFAESVVIDPAKPQHILNNTLGKLDVLSKGTIIDQCFPFTCVEVRGTWQECLGRIYSFINEVKALRNMLEYAIDGVVIDILNPEIRHYLGRKSDINQYQLAFKFEAQNSETTLRDMFYTVGKTGKITPMAVFDEIYFDNVRYDKCTVSSYGNMQSLHLGLGDTIVVQRSGDVIPYLAQNLGGGSFDFRFPHECPECGMPVVIKKEHAYCLNKKCNGLFKARLLNIVQRLDIDDLGEEIISSLVNTGIVRDYWDIFVMETVKYIEDNVPNGVKISKNIQAALLREISEEKLLYVLSLDNIASETAKKISSRLSLEELITLSGYDLKSQLRLIQGIGEKSADNIISQLDENHQLIDFFLHHFRIAKRNLFGRLYRYYTTTGWRPDEQTKLKYDSAGWQFKENLTRDCGAVIAKNLFNSSPKTDKALEWRIPVYDKEGFEREYTGGITVTYF